MSDDKGAPPSATRCTGDGDETPTAQEGAEADFPEALYALVRLLARQAAREYIASLAAKNSNPKDETP